MRQLLGAGRRMFLQAKPGVAPKRNIALDRDNYTIKYPSAYIIIPGLLMVARCFYMTEVIRRNIDETIINRLPLAERPREPIMKDLRSFKSLSV